MKYSFALDVAASQSGATFLTVRAYLNRSTPPITEARRITLDRLLANTPDAEAIKDRKWSEIRYSGR